MNWYWKVRIYHTNGHYAHCEIETERNLAVIDDRQKFYQELTGARMLLEGMQEHSYEGVPNLKKAFDILWRS